MLPPGFDPVTGRLTNATFSTPINSSTSASHSYYRETSLGWWSEFNERIADIGNWFSEWADTACTVIMWIILIAVWGSTIVGVISLFIQGEIFGGIIAAVIGGVITYYGAFILAWIGWLITAAILYGLRFLFWNGWSLVAAIILAGGITIAAKTIPDKGYVEGKSTIEQTETRATTYYCTANVLNIRSAPNVHAHIMGTLRKGEQVEVYEIVNGFARLKYQGKDCYVSMKYLAR